MKKLKNKKNKSNDTNNIKFVSSKLDFIQFIAEATLDFHEFGPMTSFDIEKTLVEFLEDCYIQKYRQVIIVTGKGLVVRPAVLKLLGELQRKKQFVESFKTAGYFNGQSGAFEIQIIS